MQQRPAVTRSALLLGALALLALAAGPARADKCTGAKLKAIGKKEAGLLGCRSKVAATNDTSGLAACETKVSGKFSAAFAKAGSCSGDAITCENTADACETTVATAMTDTFPSKCEAAKRKAAGKLASGELGCYAKAAATGLAVDSGCLSKATGKFSAALTKAGTCPDGGSPQSVVESNCVAAAVTTDGGGMVTDVCPSGVPRCATLCQPDAAAAATCMAHSDGGTTGCSTCGSGTCIVDPFGFGTITTVWDWLNQVNATNFAGHNDWRLPSEGGNNFPATGTKELETILLAPAPCGTSPCIDAIFGPTVPSTYWSASTWLYPVESALSVFFHSDSGPGVGHKNNASYVRAVRSGLGATTSGCFTDTGDGTIHDTCTGLQWEKKTNTAGVHDWNNLYNWAGCCE